MKNRYRKGGLLFGLTGMAAAVFAQAGTPGIALEHQMEHRIELLAQAGGNVMAFPPEIIISDSRTDHQASRIVKGAPYCAEVSNETTEWLMDPAGASANKIVKKTVGQMCRDSEGRTRQEREDGGRKRVLLHDPLAREHWVLDPVERTARKTGVAMVTIGANTGNEGAGTWREYGQRVRDWARNMAGRAREEVIIENVHPGAPGAHPMPPTPNAEPVTVTRNETVSPDGKRREVEVRVIRKGGHDGAASGLPPLAPLPPGIQLQAHRLAPRGPGVVTALPAKDMEGVKVHGERTTWTTEAGKIGNEKAIVQTREVWTSPELMLTVYSKDFDPRQGETVYRLSNIKLGEPQASLFKVPPGYEIKEAPPLPKLPALPAPPAAPAKG
jgi:hypothetical protein